ncbi:hypothetical protein BHM03_00005078 [Ensete ventricosum]|nr:hypothetical protein BHM03_00005078 [Ensete ventricosum]
MFGSRRVDDEMEVKKERAVRFYPNDKQNPAKSTFQGLKPDGYISSRVGNFNTGRSIVFAEDHEPWRKRILDPGSDIALKWNRIFLISCLVALFIDPLYFYLPKVEAETSNNGTCMKMDENVSVAVTVFRTLADLFYILHMVIKFRTAYVAPSSRVFGRGKLVMDPKRIAMRYLKSDFIIDLAAALPLPQMDDQLLDAICEHLVSSLSTEGTYIVREGDPVMEMLFIIRGRLESSTTDGGRTGFFNSIALRPGDFCGEELLAWALLPKVTVNLPSSTRTVRALVEVEAFALRAEDLKSVANQFRRLHSRKLQHTFRLHSHHWRSWAACFIEAAWRRYKRRKMAKDLSTRESFNSQTDEQTAEETVLEEDEVNTYSMSTSQPKQNLGATILASKFAATTRKGAQKIKLQKPEEPDFSADPYD